jgi:glycosyltransferase involved in cell wall biosynthesis
MRIVHYVRALRLEEGGVVRASIDMCQALARAGHDVVMLTCDASGAPASWNTPGAPRTSIIAPPRSLAGLLPDPAFAADLMATIRGADALHLHGAWDLSNFSAADAARAQRIPYIVSPHGMLDDWPMSLKPLKKRLALAIRGRKFLKSARFIHCAAEGELAESSRWFPPGLGRVAALPFDTADFEYLPDRAAALQAFPALAGPGPRILFLSRLVPNKGAHLLLDALPAILATCPAAQLIIAGSGDAACESDLRRQSHCLGVDRCTHFLGHVGGANKISLLRAVDAFILPTIHENFGFAILEALAAETPVITTRGAMLHQELTEGGAIIADRSAAAIAAALDGLLTDPDAAAARGRAGRTWVLDFLAPKRIISGLEDLYASPELSKTPLKPACTL